MRNIPTPHNSANIDDFAKTVLMPGDPLRAKFIAENFLEDPVLVNGGVAHVEAVIAAPPSGEEVVVVLRRVDGLGAEHLV